MVFRQVYGRKIGRNLENFATFLTIFEKSLKMGFLKKAKFGQKMAFCYKKV